MSIIYGVMINCIILTYSRLLYQCLQAKQRPNARVVYSGDLLDACDS